MQLGNLRLRTLNAGTFRLDGGAMHGVVPKALWSTLVPCDEQNRVPYSTACLLVESAGRRILVETGNGDKYSVKQRAIYAMEDRTILTALAAIDVAPETIDLVVLTHLHFDHVGGATRRDGKTLRPTFPHARHVVQARELEDATHVHERNRGSYVADDFVPLLEAGLLDLLHGEVEVAPGLRVLPTPGHTPGHQSVLIDGGDGQRALFLGDVVPTAVHVRLPFIMAYDLEPAVTLDTKRALFARAAAEGWLLCFGHDPEVDAVRLRLDAQGRPEITERLEVAG
jgi:glyoxylase-like metal-dependent hydrolase (beta-lactamase superfamily II)